jgi:adenosylmethionine-8-amino-7-oxononanoate aminotransferase
MKAQGPRSHINMPQNDCAQCWTIFPINICNRRMVKARSPVLAAAFQQGPAQGQYIRQGRGKLQFHVNHIAASGEVWSHLPQQKSSAPPRDSSMSSDQLKSTSGLPKIAWAKGSYVFDVDGKQYIDGSGGPAVYCIGHGNEEVNAAIAAQLGRVAHGYRYNFTSDPLEQLTEIIQQRCGGDLQHMVFVTGGSEAVESCLKIALQYQHAVGQKKRRRFIARERSWHGNTLGALGVSGFLERRMAFEGAYIDALRIPPANAYRPTPGALDAQDLEDIILREGEENIAAFIFEPVVGAAGGCVPAPEGYVKRVRDICSRHGVLMIADEVMCGAGRTGTWRALEHDRVSPDLTAVAKGLAAGYLPLGAAIYSKHIANAIGVAQTGHTFTAHTTCCAAGVAVQTIVSRDKLVERVAAHAETFKNMLTRALTGVEAVGDIRGRGYFLAIELVQDRTSKSPFDAGLKLHLAIRQQALENGLICYPVGGNVDGIGGDVVILAPPYNATEAELAEIVEKTARSIRQVLTRHGFA